MEWWDDEFIDGGERSGNDSDEVEVVYIFEREREEFHVKSKLMMSTWRWSEERDLKADEVGDWKSRRFGSVHHHHHDQVRSYFINGLMEWLISINRKDEQESVIDPALKDMSGSVPLYATNRRHSPVDRSSNNTPQIRRPSPPPPPPSIPYPYYDRYRQESHHHHSGYLYAPPPGFDPRYDPHPHYPHLPPPDASGHHYSPTGLPTHYIPAPPQTTGPPTTGYGHHYGPMPGPPPVAVVHTSDANTKLTDGIRRRCFNCCTTDTSTWRRSNLSPGKVLCNKCGLFERTHSRPRPEQFPHKRGALASSNLRGRTPPTQLPSLAAATGPYQYHHSSLTPLNAPPTPDYIHHTHHHHHLQQQQQQQQQHPHSLPGLQSWHPNSSSSPNSNGTSSSTSDQPQPPAQLQVLSRRSSPHIHSGSGASTPVSAAGRLSFDDRIASNSSVGAAASEQHHLRSHPPTPPLSLSRSSTTTGVNHHDQQQQQQQQEHTTPPPRDT